MEAELIFADDVRPTKDQLKRELIRRIARRYYDMDHPDEFRQRALDLQTGGGTLIERESMRRQETAFPALDAERKLLDFILKQIPRKASDGFREYQVATIKDRKRVFVHPSKITPFIREVLHELGYTVVDEKLSSTVKW